MIVYDSLSEDKKTLFYYTNSNKPTTIDIRVYEGYTNSFMFHNELVVEPGIGYYTYIPSTWKDRKVLFYERDTKKLIAPFVIDGNESLEDYDKFGYIKKLTKIEKNEIFQADINDVIREHLHDRHYKNIVDIEEGDIVFDIGFNYGIFSLGALYNGASKIYGFEPNKHVYEIVSKLYPETDKVKIFNLAVSDKNEILTFNEGHNTLVSSIILTDYNNKSYDVQAINFFEFIIKNKIEKIDFLKVDCEGSEYQIFENIPDEYLSTIKKIHVEFHGNTGLEVRPIIDKLERNGFDWVFERDRTEISEIGLIFAKNKNL